MITLRINGQLADLDEQVKVNQSLKSPLFSDITKICADTTLTIKLPLTAHNRALIGNVNIIGIQSNLPYENFRLDYQRNGINLIDNGIGYLLAINDKIEIIVIYGGFASLAKFKDLKLPDLPIPLEQGQIDWAENTYNNPTNGILFVNADFGLESSPTITVSQYAHPCVSVRTILGWINEAYNTSLPLALGESLCGSPNPLSVICVTKNARPNYATPYKYYCMPKNDGSDLDFSLAPATVLGNWKYKSEGTDAIFYGDSEIEISAQATALDGQKLTIKHFIIYRNGEREDFETEDNTSLKINVTNNERIHIAARNTLNTPLRSVWLSVNLTGDQLTHGQKFDTIHNLPDIKIIDFIKALTQLQGKFLHLSPTGFTLLSLDDILANRPQAADWSDKLISTKNISFQLSDWAQQNHIEWKEDQTDPPNRDRATLYVDNKTLPSEQIKHTLPFGELNTNENGVVIPLYLKDKPGDVDINFEKLKPRITEVFFRRAFYYNPIRLSGEQGVISMKYQGCQDVIRRPLLLSCEMKLTVMDIASFDAITPVYIEQHGGYFAVLTITTKEFSAEVELLKI